MQIQYAMIFVSDMQQATAFYRDVLEFPLRFESPGWTEFATEGATVALHPTSHAAAPRKSGADPAGTCRFGFQVEDLDAFHDRMQDHGVPCLQSPTAVHGTRVAQYSGPDELVFSVGEARH